MSARVLLTLLNELRKRNKYEACQGQNPVLNDSNFWLVPTYSIVVPFRATFRSCIRTNPTKIAVTTRFEIM